MEMVFSVDAPLSSSLAASILEAGLTYMLYQRGQIPLPYQQLQVSASQHRKQQVENKNELSPCNPNLQADISNNYDATRINSRVRIANTLLERRKRLLSNKLEKRQRQALSSESKAYNAIQPALEVMQRLLADVTLKYLGVTTLGQPKKILSIALVLGPSLYCPKEIYSFELPFSWIADERTFISKAVSDKLQSDILRQFYKKIITNVDLMDFSSKPLGKTYAHICLVTLGDLNSVVQGNSYYKDFIRLPTLPPPLFQTLSSENSNIPEGSSSMYMKTSVPYNFPQSRKCKSSKLFKIKIQHNGTTSTEQSIDFMDGNSAIDTSSSSFSGDILFDNNSFSCYQIPLRFKGVQCKNKRL